LQDTHIQRNLKRHVGKESHNYLDNVALPSSDDESEEDIHTSEHIVSELHTEKTSKQQEKDRQRELERARKQAAAREQALCDDDDAYTVRLSKMPEDGAHANARDIKVTGFSVSARGKELLKDAGLTIVAGRRYGLVGPNGAGKSTLLKLLAHRKIPVPESIDILLVEQEIVGSEQTALQAVIASDAKLMELRKQEQDLRKLLEEKSEDGKHTSSLQLDRHAPDEEIVLKLNKIYEDLKDHKSETAESRAAKILHGLGFTSGMQGRTTQSFSGGWRMRISIARALYIQPTCLLLDEPTNHLDLRAVIWLEGYLTRWKKTLIVVSHDREFLNNVSSDIIHLHDQKLDTYRGNFVSFEEMYEQRRREANKTYEKYEKQLKAARASGNKEKAKSIAEATKQRQKGRGGGSRRHNSADSDDESSASAPRRWNDYQVKFSFPTPTELSPPLIQLIDVGFAYPGREDFGMSDVNIGVDMGTRVAVVGPNGAGKSTLMNLLAGDLQPTAGESRYSHKLRVGRYSQHFVDVLQMDESPVQYLSRMFSSLGMKAEQLRGVLGKFGLPGHNHLTPIVKLSGGQKARVVFAAISLSQPHVLLMDEPTNHLDMQSIDALALALEEFQGGVVIISHDSRLVSRICEDVERAEVWDVDNGEVSVFDGSFEQYRDTLVKQIAEELDTE